MKTLLPLILPLLCFLSCSKSTDNKCAAVTSVAPASEVAAVQAYLSSKGITAQADSRGFFYTITRPGTGTPPTICSDVTISYTGRLTSGVQFDASPGIKFNLSNLIVGWQEGVPLISQGGSIVLYLPPSFGYGATAHSTIPANSIIIFYIDLVKVE